MTSKNDKSESLLEALLLIGFFLFVGGIAYLLGPAIGCIIAGILLMIAGYPRGGGNSGSTSKRNQKE